MGSDAHISERAEGLREAFDRSFVGVQHYDPVETEDFLAISAGGDSFMLRLGAIKGFFADKKVTPVPSRVAALRGLAGFRGTMLPVYDLAALLGYGTSREPRWIAIAAEAPIAFAFDSFEGHFRFQKDAIAARSAAEAAGHLREVVHNESFVRPIIDMPSIVAAIRDRSPTAGATQEH